MKMTFTEYLGLCENEDMVNHAQVYAEKQKKIDAMPAEMHIEKLKKTVKAIISHIERGGNSRHAYANHLARRYDEHADRLKEHHPEAWKSFCKDNNCSVHHSGIDYYA
jgi:hypothetical protein